MTTRKIDPATDDDEMVTWWGLVIEGYVATQDKLMDQLEEKFGLSPASFDIVIRLLRTPEQRMPMTRLASEVALTSGGFTKVADRLVKADLIRREPSATDRRVTYAALTEHGRTIGAEARRACAKILRQIVLEPLGPDQAAGLADSMRVLREVHQVR